MLNLSACMAWVVGGCLGWLRQLNAHAELAERHTAGRAGQWQVKIIFRLSLQIRNSMPSPSASEVASRRVNN